MKRSRIIFGPVILNIVPGGVVVWQARWPHQQTADGDGTALCNLFRCQARVAIEFFVAGGCTGILKHGSNPPAIPRQASGCSGARPGYFLPLRANRPEFDWRQVESEDYPTHVKNLGEIGGPEQTVQDIVSADVRQAWERPQRETEL